MEPNPMITKLAYWWISRTSRAEAEAKPEAEILPPERPMITMLSSRSEEERAVFAALILAGRPVTNAELAAFMRVSPAEASKRARQVSYLRRERIGRELRISLPLSREVRIIH
jgi:hypothetical protein